MIHPPTAPYPIIPADGVDQGYYTRFLTALSEDLAALEALEDLLRPYNPHLWQDETGRSWNVLARPTVVASGCDWPNRLWRDGAFLKLCAGSDLLGHGTYDGLNDEPPQANPEQIYAAKVAAPNSAAVATEGAVKVWLNFVHDFVEVWGEPHLTLQQVSIQAGADWPADTSTIIAMPLAVRESGAGAALLAIAVGAIELRHTPEPLELHIDDVGDEFLGSSADSSGNSSTPWTNNSGSGSTSNSGDSSTDSSGGSDSSSFVDSSSSGGSSSSIGSSTPSSHSSSSSWESQSSSPSSQSSSSPSSSSSSSSSSKIILPVNIDGRLEFIGWCASEAPNQQTEAVIKVVVYEGFKAVSPVPPWMDKAAHPERPDWVVVSAWAEDGVPVAAHVVPTKGARTSVHVCCRGNGAGSRTVHIRIRCATKASREPWEEERDPKRRAASLKFHAATRKHQ